MCCRFSQRARHCLPPAHPRPLFSLPLSRFSPVSPQVLWLTCFCFFCCCFYYCCFFLFSQRLRHALPGFSWRRCCCLLDLPYRLHTVLSLSHSLCLSCALSFRIFVFFALLFRTLLTCSARLRCDVTYAQCQCAAHSKSVSS